MSIRRLEKFSIAFSSWCNWIAWAGLVVMLGLIIADIIGNKVFSNPIPGAIEMVGFLGVVVTAFAMAFTLILRGHIQVEFFVLRMPERLRNVIAILVQLLGMALFGLLTWRAYDYARVLQTTGEVSMTARIPFYPFVYALGFSCIPVFLALSIQLYKLVVKAVSR